MRQFIVLDFDDTIFPTSALAEVEKSKRKLLLKPVVETLHKLLLTALDLGQVWILTNAQNGWVEECVQSCLPSLKPTFNKLNVLSARSTYETADCKCPEKWKEKAFQFLYDTYDFDSIVSIGDSLVEMNALIKASNNYPHIYRKTIKMAEQPSLILLQKQLNLLTSCLGKVCALEEDSKLMFKIKS